MTLKTYLKERGIYNASELSRQSEVPNTTLITWFRAEKFHMIDIVIDAFKYRQQA